MNETERNALSIALIVVGVAILAIGRKKSTSIKNSIHEDPTPHRETGDEPTDHGHVPGTIYQKVHGQLPSSRIDTTKALPDEFSYSLEDIMPNRNQDKCGSCWAFAATGVLADRAKILSSQQIQVPLSVQSMIDCAPTNPSVNSDSQINVNPSGGCHGGTAFAGFIQAKTEGVPPASDYPYIETGANTVDPETGNMSFVPSAQKCQPYDQDSLTFADSVSAVSTDDLEESVLRMKHAIYYRGPILGTFQVYQDFMSYKYGTVYSRNSDQRLGGHAIQIIGWHKGSSGEYWVCRNSWGNGWPRGAPQEHQGLFYMAMRTNGCGLEASATEALPHYITLSQLTGFFESQESNATTRELNYIGLVPMIAGVAVLMIPAKIDVH